MQKDYAQRASSREWGLNLPPNVPGFSCAARANARPASAANQSWAAAGGLTHQKRISEKSPTRANPRASYVRTALGLFVKRTARDAPRSRAASKDPATATF